MKLNKEDGGNRRFLLVQLPESTGYSDYPAISDITRQRLRSAARAHGATAEGQLALDARAGLDCGFRVLYEDKSGVRRWVPYEGGDPATLLTLLRSHNGLVEGWKTENLLIEVMLLEGYPLDSRYSQSSDFLENIVYSVRHETIPTRLLVCLDSEIAEATVEKLADFEKDVFVCCEAALTDALKVRIADALHRVRTL